MPLLPLLHEPDPIWIAISAFYLTEISLYTGAHQTKQTTVMLSEVSTMQRSQRWRPLRLIQLWFKILANIPTLNSIPFHLLSLWQLYRFQDWGSLLVGSFRTKLTLLVFLERKISKIAAIFFKGRKKKKQKTNLDPSIAANRYCWSQDFSGMSTIISYSIATEKDACFHTEHTFSTTLNITIESMTCDTGKFY